MKPSAVEGVDVQSGRETRLQIGGVPLPMEKEQIAPALKHDRRPPDGWRAGGEALIGSGDHSMLTSDGFVTDVGPAVDVR